VPILSVEHVSLLCAVPLGAARLDKRARRWFSALWRGAAPRRWDERIYLDLRQGPNATDRYALLGK